MNGMRRYSISGIFISVLLVFSIFTLLSISEVNAEETIPTNAISYENTIIIEFENGFVSSKIKTINIWVKEGNSFKSFKTEPGWAGTKSSTGQLLIFIALNPLKSGESVKFGLTTDEKVNGITWKALDQNGIVIVGATKTLTQEISEIESEKIEGIKETGSTLYGTKKFVPEKIRVGSDIRLVGNGFGLEKNLQLYLDNTILKSVKTDEQGNFLTTISIPDTHKVGTSELIIKDESGNFQSTNISVGKQKNRFLKTSEFEVSNIPTEIRYGETLTISGSAYPQSAIILAFENLDRVLEKTRVVTANSNGEWVFEEIIDRTESLGEKYVVLKNNQEGTTKNVTVKSDYTIEISTSAIRYNLGETVSITGTSEPNIKTSIWVKDQDKKILLYDIFTANANGSLSYEFVTDDIFSTGTYIVIVKQEGGSDAALVGIGQYPSTSVVALMDKTNFALNSKANLSIVGPPSSKLSITVMDSNDNIEMTDSIITTSSGKIKYAIDLADFSSGIYRVAVSALNIQDSVKFSVGLEPGSGAISLSTTSPNYSPGESILIIGQTGTNARLTLTLFDPSGNISIQTEIFSDSTGNFSSADMGIPSNAALGNWKITAQSRLDSKSVEVNVSIPTDKGLTLQIEETEFSVGSTIIIKGIALSDANWLQVEITDASDQVVVSLDTPITSDSTFYLPWTITSGFNAGSYIITISDGENSDSFEILVL